VFDGGADIDDVGHSVPGMQPTNRRRVIGPERAQEVVLWGLGDNKEVNREPDRVGMKRAPGSCLRRCRC